MDIELLSQDKLTHKPITTGQFFLGYSAIRWPQHRPDQAYVLFIWETVRDLLTSGF